MSLLEEKNRHAFDSRIKFQEEGHIYWIDDDSIDLISSTTLIHKYAHAFDADRIISYILKSYNYKKNPEYKYYGMSAKAIKTMWENNGKEASEAGTKLHADIESFYNDLKVNNTSEEYKQFLNFHEDHKDLKIYRTEWCVFSDMLKITGSIDAVFENPDGTLSIYDWKRSKEILKKSYGGKKMKEPFSHFPDCNFYHYSLQLNLYRNILETFYGKTIKEMFLGVFHPNNKDNKYIKLEIKRLETEAGNLFSYRIKDLLRLGYSKISFSSLNYYDSSDEEYEYVIESESEEEEEIIRPKRLLRIK